ncbi:uncharacterized protein B0I36DRAFT_338099 [Microdochium trichocladiopsis]|uniref:Uncharacterized protein n=1 Tax=Microdochium trichocladiopsis TaxID=1682393 RepID=A0A9P8XV68_9PEZI|nr:uncharacterized protein B0I36DRAFT_338099 [Microdochium trichocladiopsis]KAH7016559.1 hypothetical protein B0I36DRAFT_338099 [Microdochium trichocladiopsis]
MARKTSDNDSATIDSLRKTVSWLSSFQGHTVGRPSSCIDVGSQTLVSLLLGWYIRQTELLGITPHRLAIFTVFYLQTIHIRQAPCRTAIQLSMTVRATIQLSFTTRAIRSQTTAGSVNVTIQLEPSVPVLISRDGPLALHRQPQQTVCGKPRRVAQVSRLLPVLLRHPPYDSYRTGSPVAQSPQASLMRPHVHSSVLTSGPQC